MLLPAAACVLIVILAITLTALGSRGRVIDDHPICRGCRFDLVGLASPAACPECGTGLATPDAIMIGHRRRRRIPLTIGLVLLILLAAGMAIFGLAAFRGFNFNTIMPGWMLELKAQSSDATGANGALVELSKRIAAHTLAPGRTARLVQRGLEYQSNPKAPWLIGWGDVIEAAHKDGLASKEQWASYARHAFPVTTLVWPDTPASVDIGVDVGPTRLGSALTTIQGRFEVWEVVPVGGGSIEATRGSATANTIGSSMMKILIQRSPITFPASGQMQVHATWHIQALAPDGSVIADWIEEPPDVRVIQVGK